MYCCTVNILLESLFLVSAVSSMIGLNLLFRGAKRGVERAGATAFTILGVPAAVIGYTCILANSKRKNKKMANRIKAGSNPLAAPEIRKNIKILHWSSRCSQVNTETIVRIRSR